MTVRSAEVRDVAAVARLMGAYYAEDGYPFDEVRAHRALREVLADDSLGRVWVAEVEGRVEGYLAMTLGFSFEYGGRDAFIDEVYLAEPARGSGIGSQLLRRAIETGRDLGLGAVHLQVERHRPRAFELYRRFGFEEQDRRFMTLRI